MSAVAVWCIVTAGAGLVAVRLVLLSGLGLRDRLQAVVPVDETERA